MQIVKEMRNTAIAVGVGALFGAASAVVKGQSHILDMHADKSTRLNVRGVIDTTVRRLTAEGRVSAAERVEAFAKRVLMRKDVTLWKVPLALSKQFIVERLPGSIKTGMAFLAGLYLLGRDVTSSWFK